MIQIALRCPNWTTADDPDPHSGFVLEVDTFRYAHLTFMAEAFGPCSRCNAPIAEFLFVDPRSLGDLKHEVEVPDEFADAFAGKAGA